MVVDEYWQVRATLDSRSCWAAAMGSVLEPGLQDSVIWRKSLIWLVSFGLRQHQYAAHLHERRQLLTGILGRAQRVAEPSVLVVAE